MRRLAPLLLAAGGLSCGAPAPGRSPSVLSKEDEKALAAIRGGYKMAVNEAIRTEGRSLREFADLHLDPGFQGRLLTGKRVASAAEFQGEMARLLRFLGFEGGGELRARYELLDVEVHSRWISGLTIVSTGITRDAFQPLYVAGKGEAPRLGPEIQFETRWTVVLRRTGPGWRLVWAHHEVAGADPGTVEARKLLDRASRLLGAEGPVR